MITQDVTKSAKLQKLQGVYLTENGDMALLLNADKPPAIKCCSVRQHCVTACFLQLFKEFCNANKSW